MKLFSLPDSQVDKADRAQWLTPIFDLAFQVTTGTPIRTLNALARKDTALSAHARTDTALTAFARSV